MKLYFAHWRPALILRVALATAGTGFLCCAGAQDKPPSAQEVLEKYVQVTGGRAAYEKIRNQVVSGTVEFVEAGFKGTTVEYRAVPDKVYRAVELAGVGKTEAGTDGRIAWEISSETGPRIKTGEEGAAALREATFNASLRWRELYSTVELAGEVPVEGLPCYKVVLIPKAGKPITQYYDKKSGLLAKIEMVSLTPTMGEVATETYLGDFRTVDGIRVPHLVRRKVLAQQIVTHIDSVQFNAEIPKDRFDLPARIQALIPKK